MEGSFLNALASFIFLGNSSSKSVLMMSLSDTAIGNNGDQKGIPKKRTKCPNTESIKAAKITRRDRLLKDFFTHLNSVANKP
jgi:hypothetical protein